MLNLAGLSLIVAYGMNLMALPITSSTGAICQKCNIDLKPGKYMILGRCLSTICGTLVVFSMATSAIWLTVIFVITSTTAVIAMSLNRFTPTTSQKLEPSPHNLAIGTFLFNTLTGMRGGTEGTLYSFHSFVCLISICIKLSQPNYLQLNSLRSLLCFSTGIKVLQYGLKALS